MRIEKNNDGSYALTCCEIEIKALAESTLLFAAEVTNMVGLTDPMYFSAHDYRKLTTEMGKKLAEVRKNIPENLCKNCATLFDDDHPKCKANP